MSNEKTIKQWLSELPDGYRERALANMYAEAGDIYKASMGGAILGFREWYETPQGHDFWNAVYDHYTIGTPLPPLPESTPQPAERFLDPADQPDTATQCARILADLELGPRSTWELMRRHNCARPAARIADLREKGHNIRTDLVRSGRKHWALYTLVK